VVGFLEPGFPQDSPVVSAEWFYRRDGQQFGPISSRKLYRLVRRGEISAGDELWREGMPGWRPAGESKTLFGSEEVREKRMRMRRPEVSGSRRPWPSDAATVPASGPLFGRRPLLTSIGIGAAAGTLVSAVIAAILLTVDSTTWREEDAAPPPVQRAPETPAPETPAPETPEPETPEPETPEPETPEPETPEPETRDPEMLDIDALDPETPVPQPPGLTEPALRLRKRRSSY
jgi:hypothetical protein